MPDTVINAAVLVLPLTNSQQSQLIIHSDDGGQYYDKDFLSYTKHYLMRNNMCKFVYENGKAERPNGIIKNNFLKFNETNILVQLHIAYTFVKVYLYFYSICMNNPGKNKTYFTQ